MAPDFVSAERHTQLGFQSRGLGHPTEPGVLSPTPNIQLPLCGGRDWGWDEVLSGWPRMPSPITAQETEPEVLRPLCPHCLVGVWKWKHPKLEILTDSVVWGRGSGVGGRGVPLTTLILHHVPSSLCMTSRRGQLAPFPWPWSVLGWTGLSVGPHSEGNLVTLLPHV